MQEEKSNKEKAATEAKRISGDWEKFGKLLVKTTFGTESITKLMISYAERVASLRY